MKQKSEKPVVIRGLKGQSGEISWGEASSSRSHQLGF